MKWQRLSGGIKHRHLLVVLAIAFEKSNWKIPVILCGGNRSDANFQVGLQKYVIPAAGMNDEPDELRPSPTVKN